jgi:DNA-binding beta-propeller fold protein YncE
VTNLHATPRLLGEGQFQFQVVDGWGALPEGWSYGEVAGVAVDSNDNVYVMNRSVHPIIVFNSDGDFLRTWGEGQFPGRTHAIYIDPQDNVYCVDDQAHCIFVFDVFGDLKRTIGVPGTGSKKWSGIPLNLPTDVAVSPATGDIYVTDGYGNSRIHRYSADGQLIHSWGSPGTGPSEFAWPHNVEINNDGVLFINDRENYRMQIFDGDGKLLDIWYDVFRPDALGFDPAGNLVVGELCPEPFLADAPNIGHRLSILDQSGKVLQRLGDPLEGVELGQFLAPHGLKVDSQGSIYVGEVSWSMRGRLMDPPQQLRSLQKLQKVAQTTRGLGK